MNIFIAFANQDRDVRDKLLRQMNLVKDRQGWNIWSAKEIKAGERWDDEIKQRLVDSKVVILLLSTDFFNSKYIVETELPAVIDRHKRGDCQIIPVIARACHWKDTPFGEYADDYSEQSKLGSIQALPVGENPIISRGNWDSDDQPYFEVVKGIRESITASQIKKVNLDMAVSAEEEAERQQLALEKRKQEEALILKRLEDERIFTEQKTLEEQKLLGREEGKRIMHELLQKQEKVHQSANQDWQKAADAHNLQAYQTYLAQYPQGEMAREARFRIKELKRQVAASLHRGRYVVIGGGVLAFLLLVWLGSKIFSDGSRKSGLEMVAVQGGNFQMGSPANEEERSDDECQHTVSVKNFSIGKYEVTQADWREIMGNSPSYNKNCNDCPVEQVSWSDVQSFIKELNTKYSGKNYRLPKEAEWEYAARGGNKSGSHTFSGSNNLGSVAWYSDNADLKTQAVGGKAPNELGLYDMSGNVLEWCQDSWKPYPYCIGAADGASRVVRGGSVFAKPLDCRVADRYSAEATQSINPVGFRLCSVSLQ